MPDNADCPNALWLGWVKDWLDIERERNTRAVTTYRRAYDSLRACPIPFQHPSQLQQLRGFGTKLCERMTEQLRRHCELNGLPIPKRPRGGRASANSSYNTNNKRASPRYGDIDNDDVGIDLDGEAVRPKKKPRRPRAYVPVFRSGAYALVVGLSTLDEDDSSAALTKAELVAVAQKHCDASFTTPGGASKFHTAWNSMKTLITKELVFERGRPLRKYGLTDEGWEVARKIRATPQFLEDNGIEREIDEGGGRGVCADGGVDRDKDMGKGKGKSRDNGERAAMNRGYDDEDGDCDIILEAAAGPSLQPRPLGTNTGIDGRRNATINAKTTARTEPAGSGEPPVPPSPYAHVVRDGPANQADAALPTFTPIRLPPGSFTVRLLLDVREIRALTDRDFLQEELTKLGVRPIMRALEVGDAQWVAKVHDSSILTSYGAEGDEVVLDWIVERKRLDDLVASIKDGRFREQKFRLNRSGARRVAYIVEEISLDPMYLMRYEEAIQSAIASTQVVNGYFVKRTKRVDDTVKYLARMTNMLQEMYKTRTLNVIPTRVLTAQNYLPLLRHLREREKEGVSGESFSSGDGSHHVTYPAFASMASKSDAMTLRDVFVKMLMTTRGVTGEKAVEIQRLWKTPRGLVEAFERCAEGVGEQEASRRKKQMVLDAMAGMVGRRKMTRAVSDRIAEVWGDA